MAVQKLIITKPGESPSIKHGKHIVIIGMPDWQSIIKEYIQLAFGDTKPIIECPELDRVIFQLGQIEPNLLIITNFNLRCSLTLQQMIEESTVPLRNILVLCDKSTRPEVEPLGVRVIVSKFEPEKNLIPVVQELLS